MSGTPFMPLWVSDFLGDTLDLDAAEIGAYMLLLMAQWNRDGKSLPDDQEKLRRVARCGRNWGKVWGNVERYFDRDENGVYSKRLRLEAQNVAAKREVNARNGARGGVAKALKSNDAYLANANQSLQRNPSIPEPEPDIVKRDTIVSPKKSRKSQIPPDAVLSEKQLSIAVDKGHDEPEAEAQFIRFRDYCLANGKSYIDWDAAWRNWLNSPFFKPALNGGQHGNGNRNSPADDPTLRAIIRAARAH